MSDDERDEAIAAAARAHLDRSAEELDAATGTRLRAARLRALAGLEAARPTPSRRRLVLAAASAGAFGVLVAASWWLREAGAPAPIADADELEDAEILSATDDLELYDDLDFYRWLEDDAAI